MVLLNWKSVQSALNVRKWSLSLGAFKSVISKALIMKVKFKIQKITNELRYNDVMIIDLRLFHEKSRVVSITSWWQLLVLQCLKPLYLEGRYCCLIVFFPWNHKMSVFSYDSPFWGKRKVIWYVPSGPLCWNSILANNWTFGRRNSSAVSSLCLQCPSTLEFLKSREKFCVTRRFHETLFYWIG